MTILLAKAQLRREALARRAALGPASRVKFSERLKAEGLALAARHSASTVSAFHPIRDEPDTLALLAALAARGARTALPITGGPGERLTFRVFRPGDRTVPGPMRIPEPAPEAALVEPGSAIRAARRLRPARPSHRLRRRTLRPDASVICERSGPRSRSASPMRVCEVEAVPDEPHDEPLDYLLTDDELIKVAQ